MLDFTVHKSLSRQLVHSMDKLAHNDDYNYRDTLYMYTDETRGGFILRARFPEITRCSRRVHAPAHAADRPLKI